MNTLLVIILTLGGIFAALWLGLFLWLKSSPWIEQEERLWLNRLGYAVRIAVIMIGFCIFIIGGSFGTKQWSRDCAFAGSRDC